MTAAKLFIDAAVDPMGGPDAGVPDGNYSPASLVRDSLITTCPAVGSGSFACAGFVLYPTPKTFFSPITACGTSSTGTLTWATTPGTAGCSSVAIYSQMAGAFIAYRPVGIRYRVYPTSALSVLNGSVFITRWPAGAFSLSYSTALSAGLTQPAFMMNAVQTKTGPVNDPLVDGWTDFFVGSSAGSFSAAASAGTMQDSYGWIPSGSDGNWNEGMTFLWVGTASAGAVQNDPTFRVEVHSIWECMVNYTDLGLYDYTYLGGDQSALSASIETMLRLQLEASIVWKDNLHLMKLVERDSASVRRASAPMPAESLTSGMMQHRATLALKWLAEHKVAPSRELSSALDLVNGTLRQGANTEWEALSDTAGSSEPPLGPRAPTQRVVTGGQRQFRPP